MELSEQDLEEIKQWCEGLRSGEYKQTRSCLNDDDGFCCLGVGVNLFVENPDRDGDGFIVGDMPCDQKGVPKWLKKINAYVCKKTDTYLTELNDGTGDEPWLTFDEIADVVEAVVFHKALD